MQSQHKQPSKSMVELKKLHRSDITGVSNEPAQFMQNLISLLCFTGIKADDLSKIVTDYYLDAKGENLAMLQSLIAQNLAQPRRDQKLAIDTYNLMYPLNIYLVPVLSQIVIEYMNPFPAINKNAQKLLDKYASRLENAVYNTGGCGLHYCIMDSNLVFAILRGLASNQDKMTMELINQLDTVFAGGSKSKGNEKKKGLLDYLGRDLLDILEKEGQVAMNFVEQETRRAPCLDQFKELFKALFSELRQIRNIAAKRAFNLGSLFETQLHTLHLTQAMAKAIYIEIDRQGLGSQLKGLTNDPQPKKLEKALQLLGIKDPTIEFFGVDGYKVQLNNRDWEVVLKLYETHDLVLIIENLIADLSKKSFLSYFSSNKNEEKMIDKARELIILVKATNLEDAEQVKFLQNEIGKLISDRRYNDTFTTMLGNLGRKIVELSQKYMLAEYQPVVLKTNKKA